MAKRLDDQKRAAWARRIERYQASGWTVARFCQSENIAVHVFYYWAKRLGSAGSRTALPRDRGGSQVRRAANNRRFQPVSPRSVRGNDDVARVHFRLGTNAQVSIPADCTEALRCIVKCLQEPSAMTAGAFQQVRLGSR